MKKLMQKKLFITAVSAMAIFAVAISAAAIPAGTNVCPQTVKAAETAEATETEQKWNTKDSVTVTKGNCDFLTYLSEDGKESWIYQVKINGDGLYKLKFPAKVKDAAVTRIGYGRELYEEDADCYISLFGEILEPWHDCYDTDKKAEGITSITFPKTLTRIETGSFCGLKSIKKVEIPNGVEELTPYSFAACPKLKEVKLPAALTTLNVMAFDKSRAIKKFTISSKSTKYKTKNGLLLSKNAKKLIWTAPALKKLNIPKGVTKLADRALFASQAVKVTIPKSVRNIGNNSLTGEDIEKIELKKGNKVYKMDGNSIYRKSDKSLAAILIKKGTAKISSKVKVLEPGISVMGYYIEYVHIPKSVNKVVNDWMFFSDMGKGVSTKIYFHGMKPPKIVCKQPGYIFTALPIFDEVYVPKKAKKAYIQWAKDRDGLEWDKLKTF